MFQMNMFEDELIRSQETILLTIQLQYWKRVLDGVKHYEYRRVFKQYPVNAFVYAPLPDGKFVGYVEFGTPIYDTIDQICRIAEGEAHGSGPGMREYMSGLSRAYAIPIVRYEELFPITLAQVKDIFPDFIPPQSYLHLKDKPDLLSFLQDSRIRALR